MPVRFATALLTASLFALPAVASSQQKARFTDLDQALQSSSVLNGRSGPRDVNWIDSGNRFSYIETDPQSNQQVIRRFDPATLSDTLLFNAAGLTFPDTSAPFTYDSFQWAKDSKHLVFQTGFKRLYRRSGTSSYYVYTLADHSLQLAARNARTAELSPNGSMLGYERDGDMFVYDLALKRETRLTHDATPTLFNGHFDWVYEEEFGMAQAWNWSPDSRYIAYWQLNEADEPIVQLSNFSGAHPAYDSLRIPQPGDSNATVHVGVVNVHTGHQIWLDTGEHGDFYIPRIYWTSRPDSLAVVTLNRKQNEMKLFFFDVNTGGRRLVLTQTSDTWIDVYDFYAGVQDMLTFPAGSHEFLWISDRDGWQHIYRYDYSGRLIQQVTHGKWSVTRVEGIDTKRGIIYYSSTQASPLQRQLYSIHFDGTGQKQLTTTAGTHDIDMSPNARYYIDRWSSTTEPRQVELWNTAGRKLRTLEKNAESSEWLASHAYSTPELFTFTASDGARIDASIVKPVPFDSTRKYPVIFAVYGGPGSQQVYDRFDGSGFTQWLAQEGYIVVGVNNRGTNNYGRAFMKVVYEHLGKWESHDFAEAARYLATKPWVDAKHIAITGTSYGGYSTVYTMEMYPDIFTVGVANSAVTDWRLYDTIYTERYMGLLPDNASGYDSSSAVRHAAALTGHLLLIHSMMDDNVHPRNTMQLLTAATNANRNIDLRIYPPGAHGAAYNLQSYHLIEQQTDAYFARYLKGDCATTSTEAAAGMKNR